VIFLDDVDAAQGQLVGQLRQLCSRQAHRLECRAEQRPAKDPQQGADAVAAETRAPESCREGGGQFEAQHADVRLHGRVAEDHVEELRQLAGRAFNGIADHSVIASRPGSLQRLDAPHHLGADVVICQQFGGYFDRLFQADAARNRPRVRLVARDKTIANGESLTGHPQGRFGEDHRFSFEGIFWPPKLANTPRYKKLPSSAYRERG